MLSKRVRKNSFDDANVGLCDCFRCCKEFRDYERRGPTCSEVIQSGNQV